jgi:predicted RNA-binding protein with EMAP domain
MKIHGEQKAKDGCTYTIDGDVNLLTGHFTGTVKSSCTGVTTTFDKQVKTNPIKEKNKNINALTLSFNSTDNKIQWTAKIVKKEELENILKKGVEKSDFWDQIIEAAKVEIQKKVIKYFNNTDGEI